MKKCFVSAFSFIIATVLMVCCCSCGNNNDDSSQSKNIEPKIIYEENGLSIYYKGYTEKNNNVGLDLLIENNSDKSYIIQTRDFYINGYSIDPSFSPEVKAGKKSNDSIKIYKSELEKNELSYSKVEEIEFNFHVFNSDDWFDSFDSPTISLKNHDSNTEIIPSKELNETTSIDTTTEFENKLPEISNWITRNIWNDGFCDISWYVSYGTSSTGTELDIDFTIENLTYEMEKKIEYNDYILSLDDTISEQKRLIDTWNKVSEQIDILYNQVISDKPRPNDDTYEFNDDLFKQYFDSFQSLSDDIEKPVKK